MYTQLQKVYTTLSDTAHMTGSQNIPESTSHASHVCEHHTVDSRYLEIEGTLKNSSRYPYFDISDL